MRTFGRSGGFTPKGSGVGESTLAGTPCWRPSGVGDITEAGAPPWLKSCACAARERARNGMTKTGRDIGHLLETTALIINPERCPFTPNSAPICSALLLLERS